MAEATPAETNLADPQIEALARTLLERCEANGYMLRTAESCTGGLIAAALTDIAGASAVVERGLVTYSNAAKTQLLGVSPALLETHGAVSEPVARAMAAGALRGAASEAHLIVGLALSVTGIAGPGGGTAEKPEGRVHFAAAPLGGEALHVMRDFGPIGRAAVRRASVIQALELGIAATRGKPGDVRE